MDGTSGGLIMREYVVIPMNEKFNSMIYNRFCRYIDFIIDFIEEDISRDKIIMHCRTYIINYIYQNDCYTKSYTLEQIDMLARQITKAYLKQQPTLYT